MSLRSTVARRAASTPGPIQPDVEIDRRGAREQAVEMAVEVGEHAVVEADALPDAVADEEAGVEDGDLRLVRGGRTRR